MSQLVGTTRTLPVRPEPVPGESFASYVDRIAASLAMPLSTVLAATGIIDAEVGCEGEVGYGVVLDSARLTRFSYSVRLPESTVEGMLLSAYDGIAIDLAGLGDPKKLYRHVTQKQWAYFTGSQVCSACVAESEGALRLVWKLPWSFACTAHRCLLAHLCPACNGRTSTDRRRRNLPYFRGLVFDPATCHNPSSLGTKRGQPCRFDYSRIETQPLEGFAEVLAAQGRVERALDGEPQVVLGETVSPSQFFSDMRSLCSMLLLLGEAEDLDYSTRFLYEAYLRHVEERRSLLRTRDANLAAGASWRKEAKQKYYSRTPQSSTLLATLVPEALRFMDHYGAQELSESLEPFVRRAVEKFRQAPHLFTHFRLSERLGNSFIAAWNEVSPLRKRRIRAFRRGPTLKVVEGEKRGATGGLDACYVPQLFWEEPFEKYLADMLGDLTPLAGRRYCSVVLVRLSVDCTWKQAGELLGLTYGSIQGLVGKGKAALNAGDASARFVDRLYQWADAVAEDSDRINYGLRRSLLADMPLVDMPFWRALCREAGVRPGIEGGRRRFASAWLWTRLTGGDYRLSPMLVDPAERRRTTFKSYRDFVARILPKMENRLTHYGQVLLATRIADAASS